MKTKFEIKNIEPTNVFRVPEGYFEELPNLIEYRLSENIISSKLPSRNQNFEIPNNYFDTLSDRILTKISETETTQISLENLPKTNVFKVSEDYFDNLETVLKLETLSKENIFQVPDTYFDGFSNQILSKIHQKEDTKVLKVNWWQKSRVMWSAAASVMLIAGFLAFFLPNILKSDTEVALNKVSNEEIAKYLETQDLSQLEIEAVEVAKNTVKDSDNQLFEHLEVDDKDIIQHLETEDLEEI